MTDRFSDDVMVFPFFARDYHHQAHRAEIVQERGGRNPMGNKGSLGNIPSESSNPRTPVFRTEQDRSDATPGDVEANREGCSGVQGLADAAPRIRTDEAEPVSSMWLAPEWRKVERVARRLSDMADAAHAMSLPRTAYRALAEELWEAHSNALAFALAMEREAKAQRAAAATLAGTDECTFCGARFDAPRGRKVALCDDCLSDGVQG